MKAPWIQEVIDNILILSISFATLYREMLRLSNRVLGIFMDFYIVQLVYKYNSRLSLLGESLFH